LKRRESSNVPIFLEKCLELLDELKASEEEGIFRMSGTKYEVDKLRNMIDDATNDFSQVDEAKNPHNIASILKLWLRSLPEPIFPFSAYDSIMETNDILKEEDKVEYLKKIIAGLPPINRDCIFTLMQFLYKISQNVIVNKMSPVNLSICLGPNIIYPLSMDNENVDFFQQSSIQNAIISLIIQQFKTIFSVE